MEQTLKVKIQPLNAEAFKPYGQVLQPKQLIYPESEEGRVAMEMLTVKYRSSAKKMDQFAIHFSYNQTFIPVQGSLVLVVAPPPSNRDAGPARYDLDYEKVAAFLVDPGQAAFIFKGTWHNALTLGSNCTFINVTRKNPGEGTSQVEVLAEGRVDRVPASRPYVEFVDVKKRDNRLIELEL
ncbi:MAG: ureidoglycolate lyase [Deltaproteobacteria bacterium]|nr:ureidoglycolate lyase [Deltaproteobacteria bacterium]